MAKLISLTVTTLLLCSLLACSRPGESTNALGFTEIDAAARARDFKKLDEIYKAGGNLDLPDKDDVRPLHRAARDGDVELCDYLLKHHAQPSSLTSTGWSPLMLAVRDSRDGAVGVLMQWGADPMQTLRDGRTILHLALEKNSAKVLSELFRNWPQFDAKRRADLLAMRDKKGRTPLMLALDKNDMDAFSQFLSEGADPNQAYPDGTPPLVAAAAADNAVAAANLAAHGAVVNQADAKGRTAYRAALEVKDQTLAAQIYQWGGR